MLIPRSRALSAARSLGWGSPIRAAYEISKACGGHKIVFGALARRHLPNMVARSPFVVPAADALPAPARVRCLAEADDICAGKLRLFGQMVDLGDIPDWHAVIHVPGRWPVVEWWRIDLRSSERPGDVKWVWELGRHRHLVVLARAARLEPAERRWRDALSSQLTSWIAANPPEIGVNWYSNLEIALRALNWLQILALAGNQLESSLVARMSQTLYRSGSHLVADLPYTLSSMRNNHLLGDALGLVALGSCFLNDRTARRWRRLGDHLFRRQLQRHMRPDGSMIEDSLSYHRFVLEMLIVRSLLSRHTKLERDALSGAAQFLCRMGALDGRVPMYGDWDEGRALVSSGDPVDVAGSVQLALSLAGTGSRDEWRADHDEVAWYSHPGAPEEPSRAESQGRSVGGGFARMARGAFTCWLKAGSGPSHGHADLCSMVVAMDGEWVVGDPGTGSYNLRRAERDYFRSSLAHSVLRLDGQDQLVPQSTFRWRYAASGSVGTPLSSDGWVLAWGFHDAYRRLQPPRRVLRVIICSEDGVSVVDWVEGPPGCPYALSLPLPPGVTWQDGIISVGDGRQLTADLPGEVRLVQADGRAPEGWWSPTYGTLMRAQLVLASGVVAGPVVWQLSLNRGHSLRVDGNVIVTSDGMQLSAEWTSLGPRLDIER
jgi:hypothetical protein